MTSHWPDMTPTTTAPAQGMGQLDRLIIGQSVPAMRMKRMIATVAPSDAPVLIQGPTGAGKELVAEALHLLSGRKGAFVPVNCAAIPAELLESELFGHEKGAFTGAERQRVGLIEQAAEGTLFLDEIGDMPLALQAKLLRVLESRSVQRVGGGATLKVDFRLVCATHRGLAALSATQAFRTDLFYRIAVFPISIPSLAERSGDIPLILSRMMADHEAATGQNAPHFDVSALRALAVHPWPGNVRELKNVAMRACVLFPGKMITARQVRENLLNMAMPDDLDAAELPQDAVTLPEPSQFDSLLANGGDLDIRGYLRDIEVALIEAALDKRDGCVSRAAVALRLNRTTLIEKMKKYGIRRDLVA